MQIVQPTSASQIFHLLRRQMVRQFRKPLIILSPKSLLRAKDATSPLAEFAKGEFKTVIGPTRPEIEGAKVKRVIACSGKVAYDLMRKREERKAWDVAIVRIEQLYPFPHKAFSAEMRRFPNATEVVWSRTTAEPGAWFFGSTTSTRTCSTASGWATPGAWRRRRPPWATRICTRSSKGLAREAFGKIKAMC